MRKLPTDSLGKSEITTAVQRAVEAALAAVLQQQKRRPAKLPPPTRKQAAKAAADPRPSSSKHGFRGVPPPLDFSLADLSPDQLLTEFECAALTRLSTSSFEAWRKRPDHPLKWTKITGGRVRYRAGDVRQFIASGYRPRRGRPRKKDPPSAPRRRVARPRATINPGATVP